MSNSNNTMDNEDIDIPVEAIDIGGRRYVAEIIGDILHPRQFSTLVKLLNMASPLDLFEIHLSSNGGCVTTTERLANAIEKSNAEVYIHAFGENSSAATRLILAADGVEFSDDVYSLFHAGSTSRGGEAKEVWSHQVFLAEEEKKLFQKWYRDILTPEELRLVLESSGVCFNKQMWMERLRQREASRLDEFELDNELFSFEEIPKKKKIVH